MNRAELADTFARLTNIMNSDSERTAAIKGLLHNGVDAVQGAPELPYIVRELERFANGRGGIGRDIARRTLAELSTTGASK